MRDTETGPTRRRLLAALTVAVPAAGCLESTNEGPYGGYLADANGFDGVTDRTDTDTVTVAVGAGQGLAFDPAAVTVTTGTTVRWEWTGQGGRHNVAAEDGTLSSSYYVVEGKTYEHTFEETGVVEYYCAPHRGAGMLGVVEVV
ncbi:halocyanin domain-containing protein [Halobaculum sp. MBLA0143]|uniref:halocyanin domain-containing protein n=1 Tax=Halobaculum sp. MBLA0143 TaxID=3079933 RepID=UPI0035232311